MAEPLTLPPQARLPCHAVAELQTSEGTSIAVSTKSLREGPPSKDDWLHPAALLVGRQAATADLRIQHKSISRQHALVYYDSDEQLTIQDIPGAKYGTTINGQRVASGTASALRSGDVLQFGNMPTQFTVVMKGGSSSKEAEQEVDSSPGPQEAQQLAVEQAGEGLSGRAKRQAEIAAMMASLDDTPAYTKTKVVDQPSVAQNLDPVAARPSRVTKYKLPVSQSIVLPADIDDFDEGDASTQRLRKLRHLVTTLAWDPTGSRLAVGCMDSHVRLYDFGGLDPVQPKPFATLLPSDEGQYPLVSLVYSPNGDQLLVSTTSTQPVVWNRDGEEEVKFVRGDMYLANVLQTKGHIAALTGVSWHPLEKQWVATSSNDASVRIWNVQGKRNGFGLLPCHKVLPIKNKQGTKTAATSVCYHPNGRWIGVGTACGSIQLWDPKRAAGRYEKAVFGAHDRGPIVSVKFNVDGSLALTRSASDGQVRLWNVSKLSSSAQPVAVTQVETTSSEHEQSNAVFSPDGKVFCAPSSHSAQIGGVRQESGKLLFFRVPAPSGSAGEKALSPFHTVDMDSVPVIVEWNHRLNQIVVGCADGNVVVLFDADFSAKGALLSSGRRVRGMDELSKLLHSRAPQESTLVGEIINPLTDMKRGKRKRETEESKAQARREPERPASGKHKVGGQAGGLTTFQQYVADQSMNKTKVMAGRDPREALMQYADSSTGDKILADKTMEEETETGQQSD